MTFEKKMREWLISQGFFPDQADVVIEATKDSEANKPMLGRWGDNVEGYPSMMFDVLCLSARVRALEYIDAHCPKAWFRSMFAG